MAFYELDTSDKHSFIAQATVAGMKGGQKKSSYTYILMKGEDSFRVCNSFYLSTLAIS